MPCARQLVLFARPRPLLERLGEDFFKGLPTCPGVYVMRSREDRVLYVGQSSNLRRRLGTYRNANPDHLARRIIRLVHLTDRIEWEEHSSAREARLRENELLRLHRPRFNKLNTYPRAYWFVCLQTDRETLRLELSHTVLPGLETHGAFKGVCARAFASLLRLLWWITRKASSPSDFPCGFFALRVPHSWTFVAPGSAIKDLAGELRLFLQGVSDGLLQKLAAPMPEDDGVSLFTSRQRDADLETLRLFFDNGCHRNLRLSRQNGLAGPVIPQELLDDLLVEAATVK